jgi:hypothetical protein
VNATTTAEVIAQAAGHLHAAADLADEQDRDDLLSPWPPFAGQIRLIAAGLTGDPIRSFRTGRRPTESPRT